MKTAVKMVNGCCCIPLKGSVVIITILWLIYGIFKTVSNALNFAAGKNVYNYIGEYIIIRIIICVLMTSGATCGLYVVSCANTSKMLFIYSKIAYSFVAVDIIDNILGTIIILINKKAYLEACSYNSNLRKEACDVTFNSLLTTAIIFIILTPLSVYFAMVILAYANRRKEKEHAQANDGLSTTPHGQTNDGLSTTPHVQTNDDLSITPHLQTNDDLSITPHGQTNDDLSITPHLQTNDDLSITPHLQTNDDLSITPT